MQEQTKHHLLCVHGCEGTFSRHDVHIRPHYPHRPPQKTDGLWMIELPTSQPSPVPSTTSNALLPLDSESVADCLACLTFKNQFVVGLRSTNRDFPLHLWDHLLPQALVTLNLLRGSRITPRLSAEAPINGAFDLYRQWLNPAPASSSTKKATRCGTWATHAVDDWYLGPAAEDYCCYKVWIWRLPPNALSTLSWFPSKVAMSPENIRETYTLC
jgi:hypothetical protein